MSNVVTDGLVGYWNSKQGVNLNSWENIAPSTRGRYNGTINGAIVTENGMRFDGVDDNVSIPTPIELLKITDFTMEIRFNIEYIGNPRLNILSSTKGEFLSTWIGYLSLDTNGDYFFTPSPLKNYTETILSLVYKSSLNLIYFYINGVFLIAEEMFGIESPLQVFEHPTFYMGDYLKHSNPKGIMDSLRLYNRMLTPAEVQQNYLVGTGLGLATEQPSTPDVLELKIENYKVSKIVGFDISTLEFSFDSDVTEWKTVLLGASHDTGTLLDSGGSVSATSKVFSVIHGNDLYQEGSNRINIYGRNKNGWTSYIVNSH